MFHLFTGKTEQIWDQVFISNDYFGIQANYYGKKKEWSFFLHPHIDDVAKTIIYFAFDDFGQKNLFQKLYKIQWIWPKTAFNLSAIPIETIKNAVQDFDTKIFESIPWVWPKTAKRLLIELKSTINKKDISKLSMDETLYKNIVKTLTNMWYEKVKISNFVDKYISENGKIEKHNVQDAIIRIVRNIK